MARGGKLSMGGKVGIAVRGVGKGTPTRVSIRATPRTARMQALRPKTAGRPMVVKVAGVKRTPRQVRAVRVAAKRAIVPRTRSVNKSAKRGIIRAGKVARIKIQRLAKGMAKLKAGVKPKLAALKAKLNMAKGPRQKLPKAMSRLGQKVKRWMKDSKRLNRLPMRLKTRDKTTGLFKAPGRKLLRLVSGRAGLGNRMPKGSPGYNAFTRTHVEGHTAAQMTKNGLKSGTLYINNPPCSGARGCDKMLPRMLPAGARLRVVSPNGSSKIYVGRPK